MAWEDTDKVSLAVCGTSTDNPGPEQHSPLDRPTPIRVKKRNGVISNKKNKDMWEREWGALSTKGGGRKSLQEL
jgi:rRNA maturation protein Nop10